MKKKKEKRGPRGMVKRALGKEGAGPQKPPPEIGEIVWYRDRREAWRTGRFLRVIDRGRFWGKCEVKDSASGSIVKVQCEDVRAI